MNTQPDTYQRIIDSAKQLMFASSYADVGVAAICEKADVKKGSFYHFFHSKQELTLAVIDDYYAEMKENMLNEAFIPSLAPLTRLEKFIELAIDMQTSLHQQTGHILGCPFGNLATELATQDETIRSKLDKLFTRFQNIIADTLQEAVDKGDVESLDVSASANAFIAYFEGTLLLAKTHNDPQIVRQLLPAAAQIRLKPTH